MPTVAHLLPRCMQTTTGPALSRPSTRLRLNTTNGKVPNRVPDNHSHPSPRHWEWEEARRPLQPLNHNHNHNHNHRHRRRQCSTRTPRGRRLLHQRRRPDVHIPWSLRHPRPIRVAATPILSFHSTVRSPRSSLRTRHRLERNRKHLLPYTRLNRGHSRLQRTLALRSRTSRRHRRRLHSNRNRPELWHLLQCHMDTLPIHRDMQTPHRLLHQHQHQRQGHQPRA
jgi:hypothetical protein